MNDSTDGFIEMRFIMFSALRRRFASPGAISNEMTSDAIAKRRLSIALASMLVLAASVDLAQAQAVRLIAVDVKAVGEGDQTSKIVGQTVQGSMPT